MPRRPAGGPSRRRAALARASGLVGGHLIQVAILAALVLGVVAGAWVYATTPEAASGARTGPSRSNLAVQSGALVAGLVGGAITLWLNDHRRRHNQQQLAQDRERIEEERFARAVELLGHDRAAVRVGAMHALAGLAGSAAARTQTVIDVLCAYLRQPFSHPEWDEPAPTSADLAGAAPAGSTTAEDGRAAERSEADREREVRGTALRLITALLPAAAQVTVDTAVPLVDLTAARLDEIDLSDKALHLRATNAHFHRAALFTRVHFHRDAVFAAARFDRKAEFTGARFDQDAEFTVACFYWDAQFARAHFDGNARFDGAYFHGDTKFPGAHFAWDAAFSQARFDGYTVFNRAHFHGDALFAGAHFHGGAVFDQTNFGAAALFTGAHFHGDAVLSGAYFDEGAWFDARGATADGPADTRGPDVTYGGQEPPPPSGPAGP